MNLRDKTLLLTRPEAASRRFLAEVEAELGRFGRVIVSPLIGIEYLDLSPELPAGTVLAFTSEHGARAAARYAAPGVRLAYCVGERTAEVARSLGFEARVAGGNARSLAEVLLSERPTGPVLHLAGRHRSGDLADTLRAGGIAARTVVAYEQTEQTLTKPAVRVLCGEGTVLAPVFSPRSAALLSKALAGARATIWIAAISEAALDPVRDRADAAFSAVSPDSPGVIGAMRNLIESAGLP